MNNPLSFILALPGSELKLFQDSPGTAGIIVLAIVVGGLITWIGLSLLSYLHKKKMEQFPTILGDPKALLDQVCGTISLGITDRYLLSKVAFQMRLPQPVSLLLSPTLLVEAAKTWKKRHRFTTTQNWGVNRLNNIALQLFEKPLDELGFKR